MSSSPIDSPDFINLMTTAESRVVHTLAERTVAKVSGYLEILAAKRIERKSLSIIKGTGDQDSVFQILEEETKQTSSPNFKTGLAQMRIVVGSSVPFGVLTKFCILGESSEEKSEREFMVVYVKKWKYGQDQKLMIDYAACSYIHKRFQNETAKGVGIAATFFGSLGIVGGCLIAGPMGWTVLVMGSVVATGGVAAAAAGSDDSIRDEHVDDIEAAVVGHLSTSGYAHLQGNLLIMEFERDN